MSDINLKTVFSFWWGSRFRLPRGRPGGRPRNRSSALLKRGVLKRVCMWAAAPALAFAAWAQESDAAKAARMITGGSQQPARRQQTAPKPAGKPSYYVMKRFTLMD